MEVWLAVTLCAAAFVVGAAIFGFVMYKMGIEHRKKTAEAQIESAEKEASRIVSEANEKAQAKPHWLRLKTRSLSSKKTTKKKFRNSKAKPKENSRNAEQR